MASQTRYPTVAAQSGGDTNWANPNNVLLDDGSYTTLAAGAVSNPLVLTGFDFDIPAGSHIDGIVVEVKRKSSHLSGTEHVNDTELFIDWFGPFDVNFADPADWPLADAWESYGGATNLLGIDDYNNVSYSEPDTINDPDFGVSIKATSTGASAVGSMDAVRMTVHYTEPQEAVSEGVEHRLVITEGTTFNKPGDMPDVVYSVECIGGGAGGASANQDYVGRGGGGGAYSKALNVVIQDGSTYQVGQGGAANADGTDTWFQGATIGASWCGARGGKTTTTNNGGLGGLAAEGVGSTKYTGGNGGAVGSNRRGAGGGGGAAGPGGAGRAGGVANITVLNFQSGSGGGGAGGASSTVGGTAIDQSVDLPMYGTAGAGGLAQNGTAGGLGGSSTADPGFVLVSADGFPGSQGSGGGGGLGGDMIDGGGDSPPGGFGADGGDGVEWDGTHGAGGGGGGGGGSFATEGPGGGGGDGGLYGGGGGGAGRDQEALDSGSGFGVPGAGSQGVIVLTWFTAAAAPAVVVGRLKRRKGL
jgi:hypothetical protein